MRSKSTDLERPTPRGKALADVLLGLTPLLIGAQLLGFIFFLPAALRGHSSFRQLYAAGYMVRTGHAHDLYDYDAQKKVQDYVVSHEQTLMPFIRPPFDALPYVPLTVLSYRAAFLATSLLNIVFLVVTLLTLRLNVANLRARSRWLPAAIFGAFIPVGVALMMGQDSIVLLALLSWTMLALDEKKDRTAGILAGLGLFKFHVVIPFALLLLFWRRYVFFLAFACVAMALLGVSVWVAGPGQLKIYAEALLHIGADTGGSHELLRYPLPVTMMPNVHGLVAGTLRRHISKPFEMGVTGFIVVAVLAWVAQATPRLCAAKWLVPVAITASIFTSYYLFVYDLPMLLLPLILLTNHALRTSPARSDWLTSFSCVSLFLAPAVLFFLSSYFYLVSLFVFLFLIVLVRNAKHDYMERLTLKCP